MKTPIFNLQPESPEEAVQLANCLMASVPAMASSLVPALKSLLVQFAAICVEDSFENRPPHLRAHEIERLWDTLPDNHPSDFIDNELKWACSK